MYGPLAKRYARALLELGLERRNAALLQKQVADLARIYEESAPFRAIISNPGVTTAERRNIVDQIAQRSGFDPMIRNFAMLLLDNDRFDHVAGISSALNDLVDQHAGNVRAHVTTATPLKDAQVTAIKAAIAQLTGKNVLLETAVDAEIVGGVVTRIGSTVYDGSIRTQLETIRDSILEEV